MSLPLILLQLKRWGATNELNVYDSSKELPVSLFFFCSFQNTYHGITYSYSIMSCFLHNSIYYILSLEFYFTDIEDLEKAEGEFDHRHDEETPQTKDQKNKKPNIFIRKLCCSVRVLLTYLGNLSRNILKI